jgi:hypothetical protein
MWIMMDCTFIYRTVNESPNAATTLMSAGRTAFAFDGTIRLDRITAGGQL